MVEKNKTNSQIIEWGINNKIQSQNYEKLLSKADYSAISEAYKNDEIWFVTCQENQNFNLVLLDMNQRKVTKWSRNILNPV